MKRTVLHLLIVGAVVAAYLLGALAPLERGLSSLRFRMLATEATGETVIVGIDNRSLRELNVWPWPRNYHAALLDHLSAAGADRVALDIDFSSHSNEAADAAFEAAIRRTDGRTIMATFKQPVLDAEGQTQFVYTAPIPRLGRNARLGHVNVQVEDDSLVWRYRTYEQIGEIRLPGMATLLSGRSAPIETFTIDYAIRPETLPYVSYIDVLRGNFDSETFRGKSVIVGATALELGDRIPVPVHQVLPGPVVQALVAETILQDRGLVTANSGVMASIALLFGGALAWFIRRWSWQLGALLLGGLAAVLVGASVAAQVYWALLIDISPIFLAPAVLYLLNLTRSIDRLASAFRRERFESLYRRAMMNAVVDSGFDGIAIADRDGNIELVNPSATKLIGRSDSELQGIPVHAVLPWSKDIEALYDSADETRQKANVVGPLELELHRGEEILTIEMIVSSARLMLQQRKGDPPEERIVYIYTFRDISDRKEVEQAQKRAVEEAEAASRAKTEFLHNMSHELRTPLNAIIGFSDIIRKEMMGPMGVDQYKDYIADINDSGQHLLGVVNDILDMSKIESGEMTIVDGEFFPAIAIESSRRMIEDRARAAELTIEIDASGDLPELVADDRMVKQMLLNLLSNAVKFTEPGGTITIGARLDDGAIVLSVADTGIGIDEKDFGRILEPFGQADASLSREFEGTGLGLPLVKSMIELHGGTLEIESAPGEGSTFSLHFPPSRTYGTPESSTIAAE